MDRLVLDAAEAEQGFIPCVGFGFRVWGLGFRSRNQCLQHQIAKAEPLVAPLTRVKLMAVIVL